MFELCIPNDKLAEGLFERDDIADSSVGLSLEARLMLALEVSMIGTYEAEAERVNVALTVSLRVWTADSNDNDTDSVNPPL